MSNYSDQHSYSSSREYYNQDYARGTNNTSTNNNSGSNTSYSAYAADNSANTTAYGIPSVPAATPQLDLTQVASLIAQSPQALNLLLALQQVQQLSPQSTLPASSAPSYPNNNSNAGYSNGGYNEPARARSHGADYGYGGRGESSDRSDRRGRDDRSSSGGHGRRDREQYSSRRGGPPEKRDGDWICNNPNGCKNLNFSWRTECHLCHAPRDQSASRDQSGQGSESRDYGAEYNQRSSEGRDYIQYERPSYRPSDTRHSAADDTRRRGADWHCPDPKCGHFNFSKRDRCQRCSAARPSDHSTDVPRDFGASGNYPSGGTGYSDRRRERRDRPY